MTSTYLPIIAAMLLLGIGAHLLARRVRVPSILFLILIGLAIGNEGLGLVHLEMLEGALSIVVGLSVAIIVFDGAFQLRTARLREARRTTLRLVTVGAVLTLVGTAVVVRLFLDLSWALGLLVGALLVATGPTVITPILEVVRVREHVASTLEAEGIINDVTAAIAAVVIYETFVIGDGGPIDGLVGFVARFAIGIGAGSIVAGAVYLTLSSDLGRRNPLQAARFLFVSAAIGAFALGEAVAAETGIAAAVTAGILLGNAELEHRETMEEFGRDLTLLVLAFVFIAIAALVEVDPIVALGAGGLVLVLAVVLLIRPLVVAVATFGIERFTRPERLFLGAVGPRGIVPASVAMLFAVELSTNGDPETAQLLVGAVFLVIFTTVIIEGGLSRQIADALSVSPMRTIIVGGGRVGRALAQRLEKRGEFVVIVENHDPEVERARDAGFTVQAGDGTEPDVLRNAGAAEATRVVAATENDDENLLVCQLARTKFGIQDVFARVNDPGNVDAFRSIDATAIDAPMATAFAIDNEIERPDLFHWMSEIGEGHDVQEVEITSEDLVGQTIEEVNAEIPDGCIVAVIGRGAETRVPSADDTLNLGDYVTFIGDSDAVDRAVKRFHPHD